MKRLMKGIATFAVAAILMAASPLSVSAASVRTWEPVRSERADAKTVAKDGDMEIRITRSSIIVSLPRTAAVKVFTILGQQVSSENLPAGTHQLQMTAHGIYILKIGQFTCKIAL